MAHRLRPVSTWVLVLLPAVSTGFPVQESLPSARDIIARHVRAVGGADTLLAMRSRKVWARYEVPARRLSGSLELYTARPDKRVLKLGYPGEGTEVTGYDGSVGWSKKPGDALKRVTGPDLAELRDASVFDFDLHPDSLFRSITVVGRSQFENRDCYRLKLVSTSGRDWEEYYDVETGLFAGQSYRRPTAKGDVTVRIATSKYQVYEGIRLPSRVSIRSAGVEQVITVIGVEHNRVNASVFARPPGPAPND